MATEPAGPVGLHHYYAAVGNREAKLVRACGSAGAVRGLPPLVLSGGTLSGAWGWRVTQKQVQELGMM